VTIEHANFDRRTSSLPIITFCMFNERSVGNQSASIVSWISDNRLPLAAIVETWSNGHDSLSLVACLPSGYSSL